MGIDELIIQEWLSKSFLPLTRDLSTGQERRVEGRKFSIALLGEKGKKRKEIRTDWLPRRCSSVGKATVGSKHYGAKELGNYVEESILAFYAQN